MIKVSLKKIKIGTKAETLEKLRGHIKYAIVDDLVKFTVAEWKKDPKKVIHNILEKFTSSKLIVRSSALAEDCYNKSNAGHFLSVGDLPAEPQKIIEAVEKIMKTYNKNPNNQIFVQKFITPVEISGVVFSRDINNFSPYITINYDDTSGRTDTITSGQGLYHKTIVIFKGGKTKVLDSKIKRVYRAVVELEKMFKNDALDIEFLYKEKTVHILQVRPIVAAGKIVPDTKTIAKILSNMHDYIKGSSLPHPDLYGKKTLYGIMPDWNPAEMIGIKPRPLSLSLYRELITDSIWAFQRDNYGYKRLRSFPLLISLAGHPYIDVRVDFNSFIPKALDDKLSHKITDFYLSKLQLMPSSHDKVEFDIVYSCFTPDLDNRLEELRKESFNQEEINKIKSSLLNLTNEIINPNGLYKEDLKKIDILKERFEKLTESNLTHIEKIYWLMEDCKRYGTLPFAGIARAAFIAMQFLNSLVDLKIISVEEKSLFLNSLDTITKKISEDVNKFLSKQISVNNFIKIYGHLRPGTYDILSESYRENFGKYFDLGQQSEKAEHKNIANFKLNSKQISQINLLLSKNNIRVNALQLFNFIKEATEGREYAKFIFTKNVSQILTLIKEFGEKFKLSADDMSYIEINTLMKLHSTIAVPDIENIIKDEIARNRSIYELNKYIKLPHLICAPEDIYCFHMSEIEPNFITNKNVTEETEIIKPKINKKNIRGKIVFIENADPGFDWIFSHKIKGLVTAYGGANSHMAIRAAELSLPAVIGCGPALFEKWSQAKILEIDCLNKKVMTIK